MAEVVVDVLDSALGTTADLGKDVPPGARAVEVDLARTRERGARDAAREIVGVDAGCGLGHAASRWGACLERRA